MDKKRIIELIIALRLLRKYYEHAFNLDREIDADYLALVDDLLDLKEVQYMKKNIQHSDITTFEHTLCVSYIAYKLCKILDWNFRAAARAGTARTQAFGMEAKKARISVVPAEEKKRPAAKKSKEK